MDQAQLNPAQKDYLYAVLNLHRAASQSEINDRHRSLSLIFHPDKQHDETSKDVATRRFLEIQKAYQVLSDPFLREVYDALGEEGLAMNWPEEIRTKGAQEIREALELTKWHSLQKKMRNMVHPRGQLACGIDATPLFTPYKGSPQDKWPTRVLHRLEDVRMLSTELRHSIQKKINDKTHLSLMARMSRQGRASGIRLLGTIRHQFSPRLSSEASLVLHHPHNLNLVGNYRDDNNAIQIRTTIAPTTLLLAPPSLAISITRKLFRQRFEQGTLTMNIGRQPQVAFNFMSPDQFNFGGVPSFSPFVYHFEPGESPRPPSISGFQLGTSHKSCGFVLDAQDPKLVGEWGVMFSELSMQVKTGLEIGFSELSWLFSGSWSNETAEVSATTYLNSFGVLLKLEFSYLEQRLSLPLVLSQEPSTSTAFWTVVLPSSAMLVGYHFVLKPRRRAQRLAYIRAARRSLEEESGVRREREGVVALLKDTARKHTLTETSKGGLIILAATYGATETDEDTKDLRIDALVPLQALVRNSQLFIPAHQPRPGLQGFTDPAPFVPKSLHVRYLFHGRTHYAEIPDYMPVVLPLAEHLIGDD